MNEVNLVKYRLAAVQNRIDINLSVYGKENKLQMKCRRSRRRGEDATTDNRQRQLQFDERHQKFYDPLMNEPNKNYMPHKPDD